MNLLIVADVDLQGELSGAERVLAAHCLGLEKRGHQVHLIAGISDRHVKEAEEVQGVGWTSIASNPRRTDPMPRRSYDCPYRQ